MGEFRIIKSVSEIDNPDCPRQVAYVARNLASDEGTELLIAYDYAFGIFYNGVIICGCCGAPIDVQEMIEDYDEFWFFEFDSWIDLCEFIGGDLQEALHNAADAIDEKNEWTEMENILYFGG